jgi:hypothetical protein
MSWVAKSTSNYIDTITRLWPELRISFVEFGYRECHETDSAVVLAVKVVIYSSIEVCKMSVHPLATNKTYRSIYSYLLFIRKTAGHTCPWRMYLMNFQVFQQREVMKAGILTETLFSNKYYSSFAIFGS